MPHSTNLITMLCAGFVLALLLGLLAHRLRLSPLVGYLVAGVIAGPYTPGFVADQAIAAQLAEIGVILLMFGVGLHFSLRDLMQVRRAAIPGALLRIVLVAAVGWGAGRLSGWSHGAGVVFGLCLSVASTVVLLRALEARRLLETRAGRVTVGWVIVEDIAMVAVLVLLPPTAAALASGDSPMDGFWSAMLLTALKIGAFVAFMLLVGRRLIPAILERVAGIGSRELFTLCVLAIALGTAFGAAYLFGVSFALGAFFAGMLLNESELSHKAADDSLPMRDAFAVLFFVSIGMLFDPGILLTHPWQVLATCLLVVPVRWLIGTALLRMLGEARRPALIGGAVLAQIGEFSFILAGLAIALHMIDDTVRDLVLAGAMFSIVVNPMVLGLAKRMAPIDDAAADADHGGIAPDIAGHVLLVGYGRVGRELARLLRARSVPVAVVEVEPDLVRQARADGLPTLRGSGVLPEVLLDAGAPRAQLAVLAVPQALEAGEIVLRLRRIAPSLPVLARAHSEGEVQYLLERGADAAVLAERELAHSLADMVMATPAFRPTRLSADG